LGLPFDAVYLIAASSKKVDTIIQQSVDTLSSNRVGL